MGIENSFISSNPGVSYSTFAEVINRLSYDADKGLTPKQKTQKIFQDLSKIQSEIENFNGDFLPYSFVKTHRFFEEASKRLEYMRGKIENMDSLQIKTTKKLAQRVYEVSRILQRKIEVLQEFEDQYWGGHWMDYDYLNPPILSELDNIERDRRASRSPDIDGPDLRDRLDRVSKKVSRLNPQSITQESRKRELKKRIKILKSQCPSNFMLFMKKVEKYLACLCPWMLNERAATYSTSTHYYPHFSAPPRCQVIIAPDPRLPYGVSSTTVRI